MYKNPWNVTQKFERDSSSRTGDIQCQPNFSKAMNRMTHKQEILKYLELMYKHPRNISRKFEKDSSLRTGNITDNLISVRK